MLPSKLKSHLTRSSPKQLKQTPPVQADEVIKEGVVKKFSTLRWQKKYMVLFERSLLITSVPKNSNFGFHNRIRSSSIPMGVEQEEQDGP